MSLEHKWMLHCIPTTHSLSILTPKGNIFFVCHINGITRTHIISINIIGTLLSLLRVSLFFLFYDPLMCVLLRIPITFMWVLSTERVSKTLIVVEGTEHIRGYWMNDGIQCTILHRVQIYTPYQLFRHNFSVSQPNPANKSVLKRGLQALCNGVVHISWNPTWSTEYRLKNTGTETVISKTLNNDHRL